MTSTSSSSSTSRPSRPSEPPSRHSIGASPSSRLKGGGGVKQTPIRSQQHPLTPTRAKLKHAATAPVVPAAAAHISSSTVEPHACRHCHQMDIRFYCDPCLASRVEAHHSEMHRLSLARDKARASVSRLLFDQAQARLEQTSFASSSKLQPSPSQIQTISEDALPDPFDTNATDASSSFTPSPNRLALHSLLQLRAQRSAIIDRVQTVHKCISESQLAHLQGHEILKEKSAHIALRKQNLAKAWSALEGSSAAAPTAAAQRSRIAAKSRWLTHPAADHIDVPLVYTDVYTHYERQSDDPADASAVPTTESSTDQQLGAVLTRARLDLTSLQNEAVSVSAQLAATRAALSRQAFALFSVTPPDTPSSKSAASLRTRQLDLSASGSVAQRISRLSERYIPGTFGLGHSSSPSSALPARNAHRGLASADRPARAQARDQDQAQAQASVPAAYSSSSSSNWSIASLPLPLPSEARRHPREAVNGAVTYAANLLQLVATYLGIALPFAIEQHKGRLAIRPDPLWDGGGGSSAKTLYLSSSAYTHLTASHSTVARPSKLNHLAESTYGLGASTLSTIESYIHLSSGTSLPWGLSSAAAHPSKPGADPVSTGMDADTTRRPETEPKATSKSKPDQAAKSFVSALVMLCYNAAYLATKQGIQLDLVAAAANPLELLSKAMQQTHLGRLAHANHIASASIQNLSLPGLDYEQLAQILEPNNAAADSYKRGSYRPAKSSAEKGVAPHPSSTKPSKTPKILEQSYVDVGEAAASVLDIKSPTSVADKPVSQPSPSSRRTPLSKTSQATESIRPTRSAQQYDAASSLQKQRIAADVRSSAVIPAQPPPSLDFLRQRGRDASKAKQDAPSVDAVGRSTVSEAVPVPTKVGPGAVIFNGVEVGVGNLTTTGSTREGSDKKARKQMADEGWDLV